jgi:hypothetical protein
LIGSRRKKRWIRYLFSRNLMIEFINIGRWSMFYVCYVFYQVWKSWKHLGLIHLYLCSNMQLLQNNLFISTNLIGRYGHLHVIHYWFSSHLTHCRGASKSWSYDSWIITTKVVSSNPARVLDTTLCDKVCQWLAAGLWFSSGTLLSYTHKTDHLDRTEMLLKWR